MDDDISGALIKRNKSRGAGYNLGELKLLVSEKCVTYNILSMDWGGGGRSNKSIKCPKILEILNQDGKLRCTGNFSYDKTMRANWNLGKLLKYSFTRKIQIVDWTAYNFKENGSILLM